MSSCKINSASATYKREREKTTTTRTRRRKTNLIHLIYGMGNWRERARSSERARERNDICIDVIYRNGILAKVKINTQKLKRLQCKLMFAFSAACLRPKRNASEREHTDGESSCCCCFFFILYFVVAFKLHYLLICIFV